MAVVAGFALVPGVRLAGVDDDPLGGRAVERADNLADPVVVSQAGPVALHDVAGDRLDGPEDEVLGDVGAGRNVAGPVGDVVRAARFEHALCHGLTSLLGWLS